MHFATHSPGPKLGTVVKAIWRAQGTHAEFSAPDPIVPDGCVEIVFNLGDRFLDERGEVQPRALLAGQMTGPVTASPTGEVDLLGVRFFTGRAGCALRIPMWELQDALLDASSVVAGIGRLADDLRNTSDDRRIELLERELTGLLARDREPSSAVDHALAVIEANRGNVAIDRVARRVGITRRHLERLFKDDVGLGLKQCARIVRVHAALRLIEREESLSGAEIAAQCGYSDQAHLIRECKAMTGRTPARLITSERSLAVLMRAAAATHST